MKSIVIAVVIFFGLFSNAEARRHRHVEPATCSFFCDNPTYSSWGQEGRSNIPRLRSTPRQHIRAVSAQGYGGRPGRWCGWWMRQYKGIADASLNLARNWARVGTNAGGPQVGAIVVWRSHVGVITGRTDSGQWIVKSGNDGGRVRERPRSVAGAIAFRNV